MEAQEYVRILRKSWLLIAATALLGILSGGALAAASTPAYTAATRLYVSVRAQEGAASTDLNQGTSFARQAISTYVDVVNSPIVLDRAGRELEPRMTAAELAPLVSASSPANTVLLEVSVTDTSAKRAAEIANAVGESFARVVSEDLEKPSVGPSLIAVKTIAPATVPSAPSAPRIPLMLAIGLAVGLVTGVGIAVLRTNLDTRVRTAEQIEAVARRPYLGGIFVDPDAQKRPLIVHADPRSPRSEAFRRLRTSLQFVGLGDAGRSFVVTSSGPGEGKSYVAANLAIALAETGASVVLVDADLRRPRVADYLGIEGNAGLTDLLIGRAEIADVLQPWGEQALSVLPSGRIPPNPSEMLGSAAMRATVEHLERNFDYVVIDAPPVLLVADATVLSAVAGILFVAAAGKVRKADVVAALRALDAVKAVTFGVVGQMLPMRGAGGGSYGKYAYYDGDTPVIEPVPEERRSRRGLTT
ncbi:polysaccharide biosynthesis tyrosine autokinase [Curtobacterium sp. UNCCL17]|uniref:polysaccharide biosynthesis tyrosine autokinase n=1 Tax=Curtobacterium sp. UNCCL17 TaxID=1449051 RepID=UPI000488AA2F|nr:polysaccharide biosynthesis tyrosine autokinase [Curtobacterium sp. UNCCL17]